MRLTNFFFGILFAFAALFFSTAAIFYCAGGGPMIAPLFIIMVAFLIVNAIDFLSPDGISGFWGKFCLRKMRPKQMFFLLSSYFCFVAAWIYCLFYIVQKFDLNEEESLPWNRLAVRAYPTDPLEANGCPADGQEYTGIDCFGVPLGISLAKFRFLMGKDVDIVELHSKRAYTSRTFRVKGASILDCKWNYDARFTQYADCYRLTEISGSLNGLSSEVVGYYTKKFGPPQRNGDNVYHWQKDQSELSLYQYSSGPFLRFEYHFVSK